MDDALHVLQLHRLRECTVGTFAHAGRSEHRKPVPVIPGCSASHVRNLAHDCGAVFVNTVGQFPKPWHDAVVTCVELTENRWTVR